MRFTRVLASLFALVVMTATPLVAVASADASPQQAHHVSTAEKAKHRTISIKFSANGGASFRLYGKVSPKGQSVRVVLLYSSSPKGKFKTLSKSKTNKAGTYAFTGLKKEGYFIVASAASQGYGAGHSKVERVCKGVC